MPKVIQSQSRFKPSVAFKSTKEKIQDLDNEIMCNFCLLNDRCTHAEARKLWARIDRLLDTRLFFMNQERYPD